MNLPLQCVWQSAGGRGNHLLVVLHGRGDSAEGFVWLRDALAINGLDYLLLSAPEPYGPGFSWYGLPPDQRPGIMRSRRVLAEVLGKTEADGYPPERTLLFGFSQGCLMTLEFGARYPRPLLGYVGISGYVYDPEALLAELDPAVNRGNWLITHGTDDDLLPVARTREQVRRLQEGGFRLDYREFDKGHTIDFERELPEIREWIRSRCALDSR